MIINKARLKNFYNFSNAEINFSNINIITGRNGSGKSTITTELLTYLFFGKSVKKSDTQSMIKYGEKSGYVEIHMNNSNIILRRYLNDTKFRNKILIIKDNDDFFGILNKPIYKNKDISDIINSTLKLDYNEFLNIFLRHPETKTFIQNKDMTFINNLLGIDKLFSFIDNVNKVYTSISKNKTEYEQYFDKYNKNIEEFNNKMKSLLENKDKYDENVVRKIREEIESINTQKEKLKQKMQNITKETEKYQKEIEKLEIEQRKYIDEKQNLTNMLTEKTTTKNHYINEINKINKVKKHTICPFCQSKIDKEFLISKENEFKSIINNINEEIKALNHKINQIDEKINEYKSKIDKLHIEKRKYETEYMKKIRTKLDELDKLSSQKYSELIKYENYNNTQKLIDELKNNIDILNKQIKEIEENINKINRDYLIATFLRNIFNKKSKYIKMYYDLNIASYKKLVIEILNYFMDNTIHNIDINPDTSNFIFINNIPYSSLSSAQKKIVELAFIFAYILLYSEHRKIMFFVLDEFFDNNLDDINRERLFTYLIEFFNIIKTKRNIDIQLFITTNNIDFFDNYVKQHNHKIDTNLIKIIKL